MHSSQLQNIYKLYIKKHIALISLVLTITFVGCNDNVISSIPDYPVYLNLDLISTYPNFKNSTNQFLYFKDRSGLAESSRIGYGGILVNSGISLDDNGNSIYYAYDMACPLEAKNTVRVYPDPKGLPHVICEKCGSVYDVGFGNGNPISGPAKEYLKRYRTMQTGNYLQVTR